MPPRKEKTEPQASEIDLPLGIKFKVMATKQVMPYAGWIVAVGAGFYFINGPVKESLASLETRVRVVEGQVQEVRDDVKETQRDVKRLYRIQLGRVSDASGTEVSALAAPTATAYGPAE